VKEFNCENVLVLANKKDDAASLKAGLKKLGIDCSVKTPSDIIKKDDEKIRKLLTECDTIVYYAHHNLVRAERNSENDTLFYETTKELFELFKMIYGTISENPKRIIVPVEKNSAFESIPENSGFYAAFPTGFFRSLKNELQGSKVMIINSKREELEREHPEKCKSEFFRF
jgi:hypothetical protein